MQDKSVEPFAFVFYVPGQGYLYIVAHIYLFSTLHCQHCYYASVQSNILN